MKKNNMPYKCKLLSMDLLAIFHKYQDKNNILIPVLKDIKNKFGYITEEDVVCVAEFLGISVNHIKKTLSFNNELEVIPVKEHTVKVCNGMVCRFCGADKIINKACDELSKIPEENDQDIKLKFEVADCFGLCEIAPVLAIDNTFYGKINESDTASLIAHEKQKLFGSHDDSGENS